jgi:hypothetical protein
MADNGIAELFPRSYRIEPQDLIHDLLDDKVLWTTDTWEPLSYEFLV